MSGHGGLPGGDELPGQNLPPGRDLLAADDDLLAYARALPGSGSATASFFWSSAVGWLRVRLDTDDVDAGAGPGAEVHLAAEPVASLPHRLTARELDVLTLLAIGLSNTEVGAALVTSPRTISTHVEHILAKLGQASRTGAAAMAVERGYLRLPLPAGRAQSAGGWPASALTICQLHARVLASTGEPAAGRAADVKISAPPPRPARRGTALRPLRIGSAFPLGGLAGDDGLQMRNGAALAIAELNARGGIAGRRIEHTVVDVDIFSADGVDRAFRQLFAADVDAVTSGYVFPEGIAASLAARYGAPYVHAMTSQAQAETVRENHSQFRNVFQVCPTEVNYGPGFIRFLDQEAAHGWLPRWRRIAFVETDFPSGQMVNPLTIGTAERSGWDIAGVRTVPAIGADWAAVVAELERLDPAAIMIAQFLASELAAFQRLAAVRLPDTVIYAIYAPSVPEFLQTAGPAAEGLVWATVTGTYEDSIGRRFRADYESAYGQPPGWSHAGIAYDEIHLLARAWMATADPRDFAAVSGELRRLRYRGVNGSYFLQNAEQSGLSFPDTTPDPSLGQAHLVLQVQNGSHRIISPAPYAESRFLPPGTGHSGPLAARWQRP
ncbi:MAG TPA: ABC transporter substrate-binding protein [Streptosporangiaceae bacterium]